MMSSRPSTRVSSVQPAPPLLPGKAAELPRRSSRVSPRGHPDGVRLQPRQRRRQRPTCRELGPRAGTTGDRRRRGPRPPRGGPTGHGRAPARTADTATGPGCWDHRCQGSVKLQPRTAGILQALPPPRPLNSAMQLDDEFVHCLRHWWPAQRSGTHGAAAGGPATRLSRGDLMQPGSAARLRASGRRRRPRLGREPGRHLRHAEADQDTLRVVVLLTGLAHARKPRRSEGVCQRA